MKIRSVIAMHIWTIFEIKSKCQLTKFFETYVMPTRRETQSFYKIILSLCFILFARSEKMKCSNILYNHIFPKDWGWQVFFHFIFNTLYSLQIWELRIILDNSLRFPAYERDFFTNHLFSKYKLLKISITQQVIWPHW